MLQRKKIKNSFQLKKYENISIQKNFIPSCSNGWLKHRCIPYAKIKQFI